MKRMVTVMALITLFCFSSAAQKKHFERVEKLPEGEQVRHSIGSFFGGIKDGNVEEFTFDAPYEVVWPAVKRVAETFAKTGKRPVTAIEEENGRIQNGVITQNAFIGAGPGAWLDLFLSEATQVSTTKTKVSIMRKVVEKEITGDREIKTQWSNGKLERYLLTQIEDEIKNSGATTASNVDVSNEPMKSLAGKYIKKGKPTDYIEFKSNGTFSGWEYGMAQKGNFRLDGNAVIMNLGGVLEIKGDISGDTITWESDNSVYVKEGSAAASSISSDVLTNSDVLKMIEAKLPDSIIIAKIRTSACKFDTSTDALIKLKQAGVSDAIIQAMVEAALK